MSQPYRPRTDALSVRLTPDERAGIDQRARADHRTASEMLRIMVAYAARHMPEGWKP